MILIYLSIVLFVSLSANIFAIFKIKSIKKQPTQTMDARDLIHDITKRGRAVVQIQVLDPENLFVIRRGH